MLLNTSGKNLTNDMFKTVSYKIAKNLTIPANTSLPTALIPLPKYTGYKAIMVVPENAWNKSNYLWYTHLNDAGNLNYRVGNLTNAEVTCDLCIRILYVKSELVGNNTEIYN